MIGRSWCVWWITYCISFWKRYFRRWIICVRISVCILKYLSARIDVSLQMPHRTLAVPIIMDLIHVWAIDDWMHESLRVIGLSSRCVTFSEAHKNVSSPVKLKTLWAIFLKACLWFGLPAQLFRRWIFYACKIKCLPANSYGVVLTMHKWSALLHQSMCYELCLIYLTLWLACMHVALVSLIWCRAVLWVSQIKICNSRCAPDLLRTIIFADENFRYGRLSSGGQNTYMRNIYAWWQDFFPQSWYGFSDWWYSSCVL